MIRKVIAYMFVFLLSHSALSSAAETIAPAEQTTIVSPTPAAIEYPSVVIYTLSTCPHCRDAKQYLTANGIPFINREVDSDDAHMAELMKIYDSMGVPDQSRGVPLFVIDGKIKISGFDKVKLEKTLKDFPQKTKK